MSGFSGWSPQGLEVGAARAQVRTDLLTLRLKVTLESRCPIMSDSYKVGSVKRIEFLISF